MLMVMVIVSLRVDMLMWLMVMMLTRRACLLIIIRTYRLMRMVVRMNWRMRMRMPMTALLSMMMKLMEENQSNPINDQT